MTANGLLEKCSQLEDLIKETSSIESEVINRIFGKVKTGLIRAFYLGYGWVYPDGSWTPGYHWGSQADYRNEVMGIEFQRIESSNNPQELIDVLFATGRKYFSREEYEQLYPMFQLLFILEKRTIFSEKILAILQEIDSDLLSESFPSIPEFIGYAGENSYTEDEKQKMKQERLARKEEERKRRLEKERGDNERMQKLHLRIQDYLLEKGICPDCKAILAEGDSCPNCGSRFSIPF